MQEYKDKPCTEDRDPEYCESACTGVSGAKHTGCSLIGVCKYYKEAKNAQVNDVYNVPKG